MPTVASISPMQAEMNPLSTDLATTTTMAESPKKASRAYSAGPKLRAARASNGEIKINASTPTVPPMNEETVAMPIALPPSPRRDRGYPSKVVIREAGQPGIFSRIAAMLPP